MKNKPPARFTSSRAVLIDFYVFLREPGATSYIRRFRGPGSILLREWFTCARPAGLIYGGIVTELTVGLLERPGRIFRWDWLLFDRKESRCNFEVLVGEERNSCSYSMSGEFLITWVYGKIVLKSNKSYAVAVLWSARVWNSEFAGSNVCKYKNLPSLLK